MRGLRGHEQGRRVLGAGRSRVDEAILGEQQLAVDRHRPLALPLQLQLARVVRPFERKKIHCVQRVRSFD